MEGWWRWYQAIGHMVKPNKEKSLNKHTHSSRRMNARGSLRGLKLNVNPEVSTLFTGIRILLRKWALHYERSHTQIAFGKKKIKTKFDFHTLCRRLYLGDIHRIFRRIAPLGGITRLLPWNFHSSFLDLRVLSETFLQFHRLVVGDTWPLASIGALQGNGGETVKLLSKYVRVNVNLNWIQSGKISKPGNIHGPDMQYQCTPHLWALVKH